MPSTFKPCTVSRIAEIRYRDRESGEIVTELLFGEKELRFLYENAFGRMMTDLVLRDERMNRIYGMLNRSKSSRKRIPDFIKRLGIDPSETERPVEDYGSLDEFFTRRLKPEARPVDEKPNHLISPADGRVLVIPECGNELVVKGSRVTLPDLLGDNDLAARFMGGACMVVRLAPADYHRYHFPAAGEASAAKTLGRGLHSVHPVALEAGAAAFRNKRMVTRIRSDHFGELILVEVGALIVGTMVQTYSPGRVTRGQEKGYFRFGGSTVILLAEPGKVALDEDLIASSAEDLETLVKFGSRIGTAASGR